MGLISRKLFPACESMCICCPVLRSTSRQPVKRYKKLLSDIFPKHIDGVANERKIVKLCEYAAKNPIRIPKGSAVNSFSLKNKDYPLVYGKDAGTQCDESSTRACLEDCLEPEVVKGRIVICEGVSGTWLSVYRGCCRSHCLP